MIAWLLNNQPEVHDRCIAAIVVQSIGARPQNELTGRPRIRTDSAAPRALRRFLFIVIVSGILAVINHALCYSAIYKSVTKF